MIGGFIALLVIVVIIIKAKSYFRKQEIEKEQLDIENKNIEKHVNRRFGKGD